MKTLARSHLAAAGALSLLLAACGDREAAAPAPAPPPPAASTAPAPAPAPAPATAAATDQWVGQWNGPEGTFVRIAGANGQYELTIQNLDGPRTFPGVAAGDAIEFERDGKKEALRASNGEQTGMKWLAEKKDCLTVAAGEGYCRD